VFPWQLSKRVQIGILLAFVGLGMGCSTARKTAHAGEEAVADQNWDRAVYHYLQALTEDPSNIEYRMQLSRARQKAAQQHFGKGVMLRGMGQLYSARDEFEMATQLNPSDQYAQQTLDEIQKDIEVTEGPGGMADLEAMKAKAREAKVRPPVLDPTSKEPITLRFPQPKPVQEIYKALGKAYGFNVLFDPKLKDDKLSVELNDVNAERALEIVLQAAGHFYKVLDSHSIIIAEDTPQNRRDYEDLVIKTFFLSNAEVKDVDKLLRALIEARRLSTNEQLNSITLRDTADKVAIAEKLIEVNDKAKAEVVVDVQLLLVSTTNNQNLGMQLSSYSFTFAADTASIMEAAGVAGDHGNSLPLNLLDHIGAANTFVNIPNVIINLMKSSSRAEVLANPQLRVTEGEKAKLHIGDKYPIPVTAFNSGNTIGGNVVPITSFQYQDIGIKIDVEPRVHHNREVTLKLKVEVSNLAGEVEVGPGQNAVVIGTRNIDSVIRLKNGETSLLAGLFRNDTSQTDSKIPGLSSIPLIGRLFTNKNTSSKRTDLILTLTPHIVRFPNIRDEDLAPLWVGTESKMSFYGSNRPRVASGRSSTGPFDSRRKPNQSKPTRPPARGADHAFGTRAIPTPKRPSGGVNLVPGSGKKSLEVDSDDEGRTEIPEPKIDFKATPILINLQPSVISASTADSTEPISFPWISISIRRSSVLRKLRALEMFRSSTAGWMWKKAFCIWFW